MSTSPEKVNALLADAVMSKHTADEEVIVIVPVPEEALNITLSDRVGAEAPPAPPGLADQFVVVLAFQVPEPPTQYLSATVILHDYLIQYLVLFAANKKAHRGVLSCLPIPG
jgi:hypothetical protein